jgi:hypothetical protein
MEKYFVSKTSVHHWGFLGYALIKVLENNAFETVVKTDSRIIEDIDFLPGIKGCEQYLLEFLDEDSAKLWFALEHGLI